MKWTILAKDSRDIIKTLLANRNLKTKKEIDEFLNPSYPEFKLDSTKAITRIKQAIRNKEPIVVYGDYDADGICATAIMWEAIRDLGGKALPFIPSREKEGYGLSAEGIDNIDPKTKLIITVDSGIVANLAVDYAKKKGMDVIILDHHEKPKKLPKALAIVHTEKLCASGLAYFVTSQLGAKPDLELAAIATVTDLIPLTGVNRAIVKHGLEILNRTTRPGLKALFKVAGLERIGTYEIGFMIGPRLNASGRIDNALMALRLLCTKDPEKARELAALLNQTNRERQDLLGEQTIHALLLAAGNQQPDEKIIILEHESYHQGVIGLIAGKLVERYYLPAIVIARGEKISKASARSISGFNIIEAIRSASKLLLNAGGHPMAAGFTIETVNIIEFRTQLLKFAAEKITNDMLEKTLRIDCELDIVNVNLGLYKSLAQFSPFGMGNPEPVFASEVTIENIRSVGQEGKHLKLVTSGIDAIAFNQAAMAAQLKVGTKVKIAYSLALDTFNGNHKIQLKVKDIWKNS